MLACGLCMSASESFRDAVYIGAMVIDWLKHVNIGQILDI